MAQLSHSIAERPACSAPSPPKGSRLVSMPENPLSFDSIHHSISTQLTRVGRKMKVRRARRAGREREHRGRGSAQELPSSRSSTRATIKDRTMLATFTKLKTNDICP